MAAESIRLCFASLPQAYRNGGDLEARTAMAYGSLLAAFSYGSAGLNAVHALAYALASLTHATHGSTNAVFLPYVMDSLLSVRETDLADIGRMAGLQGTQGELARGGIAHTRELVAALGIPTTLRECGIEEHQLETLVQGGLGVARLTKAFPLQPAESIYRVIVRNAYDGTLSR